MEKGSHGEGETQTHMLDRAVEHGWREEHLSKVKKERWTICNSQDRKQPKCPLTGKCIKKMGSVCVCVTYIHAVDNYSTIRE